jgi:hypothetical protein
MVQAPLLWLGASDPCKTRELVERNDPDRETFARLIYLWHKVFGPRPIVTKEITGLIVRKTGDAPEGRELLEMVVELAPGKGSDAFNAVALGKYLRSKEERMSGGLRLTQGGAGGVSNPHGNFASNITVLACQNYGGRGFVSGTSGNSTSPRSGFSHLFGKIYPPSVVQSHVSYC